MTLVFLRRVPSASGLCLSAPVARAFLAIGPINRSIEEERRVQVLVRDNNVDQALKMLKKKMQREGVFREMNSAAITKNPLSREFGTRRKPSVARASSLAKSCSARVCCR